MAITSYDLTSEKKLLKKNEFKSPYLVSDKVQLLSRLTEKRVVQKKTLDYISSFPLAANIYKASSGEFKSLKRANKKIKKSVLTLPNEPTCSPQICTASDMNDSEYYSQSNVDKPRIKKRTAIKNVRKPVFKNKEFLYYDRDARYCSQYDINLDSSSTDLIKNHRGDCRRLSNFTKQKGYKNNKNEENEDDTKPNSVWAVLRNLNRFPFHASPPMSDESIPCPKKKKAKKKHINCKNTRLVETCHTEEFAYSISYDLDDNSGSLSQSSSFDRVTVIDKEDEFSKICKDIEVRVLKRRVSGNLNDSDNKDHSNALVKPKKRGINKKNNHKALCVVVPKDPDVSLVQSRDTDFSVKNQNVKEIDSTSRNIVIPRDKECSDYTVNNNKSENGVEGTLNHTKDSFIHSENTGSSKAEISGTDASKLKGVNITEKNSLPGTTHAFQRKTISKLNLGNTWEPTTSPILSRWPEIKRPRSRLVTTMPSGCMLPKLTFAEIKNRLASMRYPIVILGKEQVNSFLELPDYDPPQFDGLDKQIWPFMVKWDQTNKLDEVEVAQNTIAKSNNGRVSRKSNNLDLNSNSTKPCRPYNDVVTNSKDKKYDVNTNRSVLYPEIANKLRQCRNQKSFTQLKEKMLNLLYEKILNGDIINDNYDYNSMKQPYNKYLMGDVTSPLNNKPTEKLDECPEIEIKSTISQAPSVSPISSARSPKPLDRQQIKKRQYELNRPWAKAKRTNDFIENVIKKIKSGVYFNLENVNSIDATDIAMQTDNLDTNSNVDIISPKVTIMKKQNITCTIPGFDNNLPGLEIETLNVNQIVIKHCVRNIMMQFDVIVPTEANKGVTSPKTSAPIVEVTENHTKIFKCKTTLLNAMLPAELCSILPKLMKLIDPDVKALRPLCSGFINKTQSHLSTISELSRKMSDTSAPVFIEEPRLCSASAFVHESPAVNKLLGGMFSSTHKITKNNNPPAINCSTLYHGLLHKPISTVFLIESDIAIYRIKSLFVSELPQPNEKSIIANQSNLGLSVKLEKECNPCTALELYTPKNKRLVQPFNPYSFEYVITNILNKTHILSIRVNIMWNFNILKPQNYDDRDLKNLNVCYTAAPDYEGIEKKVYVTVDDMNINNLNSEDKRYNNIVTRKDSKKCIEYIKNSANSNSENKEQSSTSECRATNNKSKRKQGYYRLYRKCKSATNIYTPSSVEKGVNTQLNKIQNLEDFFQILGSKKLSGVFDGYAERKILSSVVEMKNWITDINPTQAMLLLLLTNKKDTPNLVRFRPILLQGIAVNRITRATELDMEIEVIERENLHKLSQFEGISYGPVSVQDDNRLLEELYWIAKTTASDYQKPFDESSERLLKSLLEKRKKLNPSYLRVMARYVGLGLLKSPFKK